MQQPIPAAPADEAGMGWLRALDTSLNWNYKFRERFEIQPGVSFFNIMNFANFDGPGNPLSGVLNGSLGSVNGNFWRATQQQPARGSALEYSLWDRPVCWSFR